MPISHLVSISIPADQLAQAQAALQTLQSILAPYLLDLSAQQRRELPKMGDRTLAFVGKALGYAQAQPAMCPSYLDVAEFARDFAAVQTLVEVLRPLRHLADMADDTALAAGSDAYGAALSFYQAVKAAARSRVPNAESVAQDLAASFPSRAAAAASPAPAPAAAA